MASIILKPNKSLDLEKMYEQVITSLPAYACPQFLRIQVILWSKCTTKLKVRKLGGSLIGK
jgi:solute carrier family 27 fatty acid transporter 6